jgi:hypothetical protein
MLVQHVQSFPSNPSEVTSPQFRTTTGALILAELRYFTRLSATHCVKMIIVIPKKNSPSHCEWVTSDTKSNLGLILAGSGSCQRRIFVVPNSGRVAGLTAAAAPSSTTCVSAVRLADTSSPSSVSPTPAKPTSVSAPLR